jgi:predicted NUDIX family NTP pyrophosphohydrolase
MKNVSCGLMMYRIAGNNLEIFLVHPGGPFFKNKDNGVWSVPKGIPDDGEDMLQSAKREFAEETGINVHAEKFIYLESIKQKGGKVVYCWAFEGNIEPGYEVKSNNFKVELPKGSGKYYEYPEVDKAEFFPGETAMLKINPAQKDFITRLKNNLRK